jgi:hypothetical protein
MRNLRSSDEGHITRQWDKLTCLQSVQGGYLLDLESMRRVLTFGLAVSVFGASLVPLSACALLSSKTTECAEAKAQSPCDEIHPQSAGTQFSKGSDKSCCVTSQAPLPELEFNGVQVGPAVTIAAVQNTLEVPSARPEAAFLVVETSSPPCFQSLLCTFLI